MPTWQWPRQTWPKSKAGARQEALDSAQAQLVQAQVAEEASRVAWQDAQAMLDDPQELGLSLTAAQSQLGVLNFQERQAQAMANSAQAGRDLADTAVQMLESFEPYDQWIPVGTFTVDSLPLDIPLPSGIESGEYRWKRYKLIFHGGTIELWHLAQISFLPMRCPAPGMSRQPPPTNRGPPGLPWHRPRRLSRGPGVTWPR